MVGYRQRIDKTGTGISYVKGSDLTIESQLALIEKQLEARDEPSVRKRLEDTEARLATANEELVKVTDALELTLGLRYTSEEKTLDTHYANLGTGLPCFAFSLCL